ncbi:unnamed protein product [Euphydryas editha]|uniref:Uncharacterized protein n=1 Tax=Euphydryas editha TaxID=104508 RepID=A0AAU9TT26_EUPED|nr:unnamed protein product [Euphydryas editha]
MGGATGTVKDFSKRLPELRVEDGVNDGVEERVDVAQPRGQDEDSDSRGMVKTEFGANRIQDGACEERCPAEQEDACGRRNSFRYY